MILVTDLDTIKSRDYGALQCEYCSIIFYKMKKIILEGQKGRLFTKLDCCSPRCYNLKDGITSICNCAQCGKQFTRNKRRIVKTKQVFCGQSCSGTYNNTHKKYGTRRSKIEIWLEKELSTSFPYLEIHYCRKDSIDSELDICIPKLNLAFELNGIFHYKPIYGEDHLLSVQNNDGKKLKACLERKIDLHSIDISDIKHFTPTSG